MNSRSWHSISDEPNQIRRLQSIWPGKWGSLIGHLTKLVSGGGIDWTKDDVADRTLGVEV